MFDTETFIVRIADDAMAPRVRAGDYIWIDPDAPAAHTAAWSRCATLRAARRPSSGASSSVTGAGPCALKTSVAPSAPSTPTMKPISRAS